MSFKDIGCGVRERYSDSRGGKLNYLLPCPTCGEPNSLTTQEIKAGKECAECVTEMKNGDDKEDNERDV
jgi:hypothetical protein